MCENELKQHLDNETHNIEMYVLVIDDNEIWEEYCIGQDEEDNHKCIYLPGHVIKTY